MNQTRAHTAALPITIRSLTKRYGPLYALDRVDLDVRSGEFLTLLGPSGSGKTTLLMALAGFTRPDDGSIRFGTEEVIRRPPHKRDVGMVFQNYALFPHMNVEANISFPLRLRKVPARDIAERVREALARVQLGGLGDRGIDQLSGGQRQRVALARAIVFEPRVLLMDEPLSALDKKLREHMQIELRRLHESLGMTTVYVTHDQREALTMSDRVAVINFGRVMQLDTPRKLYDLPANKFVADFIGESTFLPVDVSSGKARCQGRELLLSDSVPVHGNGRQLLMLRPERLKLLPEGHATDNMNVFRGTVAQIAFQGESMLVVVRLEDGTEVGVRGVTRHQEMAAVPETGGQVALGLDRRDTVLIPDDDGADGGR
jgi:putative spermidine/putrescine transport system ATP-binding protein